VWGESQGSGGAPSRAHSKLATGSDAENLNVGVESFVGVGSSGPDWNVALGPAVGPDCARTGAAGATAPSTAAIDAARMSLP
jgi:hypothetical protein